MEVRRLIWCGTISFGPSFQRQALATPSESYQRDMIPGAQVAKRIGYEVIERIPLKYLNVTRHPFLILPTITLLVPITLISSIAALPAIIPETSRDNTAPRGFGRSPGWRRVESKIQGPPGPSWRTVQPAQPEEPVDPEVDLIDARRGGPDWRRAQAGRGGPDWRKPTPPPVGSLSGESLD
ncbi:hypothetical protein CC1G_10285 [Coprinopsis cinerea okayama7|uniref:Uncharacterized protein n=1 Tax=Coprinopsis cinerea (strain Okayama-7 / 130 / ATCC MYA-4618 / FGSC 9003) TaxID=240176 RepID=A8N164_COPC7|nr:hypothetical protein CC1G_10285 [Coprinopsis cinerea okayama7\|eukprot:XP_001828614.2 hypothetical protein CC1G_10285 [Coprinopsis cinerea okayama7\